MAASAFCPARAEDVLASSENIEGLPPWRLKRLEVSIAQVLVELGDESSTDTDMLQRLDGRHAVVLEAMLRYTAKYTPQESGMETAAETQARSSSTRFNNIDDVREHLEANLSRVWYRSRNYEQTPPTTGAARRRREARARGEEARGHIRGVTLDADRLSWSQRKKQRRHNNQQRRAAEAGE